MGKIFKKDIQKTACDLLLLWINYKLFSEHATDIKYAADLKDGVWVFIWSNYFDSVFYH